MHRRSFLASLGAVVGAGCTTQAQSADRSPTASPTETATETTTHTATPQPNEVVGIELPDEVSVGEPVPVTVTMTNPGGGGERYIWAYDVFDVDAEALFEQTVTFRFDDGETEMEKTFDVEWGTSHATTLLFNFGSADAFLVNPDGTEAQFTHEVQVVG